MEYVAWLSYGKDSMYMLKIIERDRLRLDRILTVDTFATNCIPAILPDMIEFQRKADDKIKNLFGIEVEHLSTGKNFQDEFYRKRTKGNHIGQIIGFPSAQCNWCNNILKQGVFKQFQNKENYTQYVGICANEPKRYLRLQGTNKIAPLYEKGITEIQCYTWCIENDLLALTYKTETRDGCWFCYNKNKKHFEMIRKNYPEYWELLLQWDKDSPYYFFRDGTSLHDLDKELKLKDEYLRSRKKLF